MTGPARTFVVVSHTHWDREWYQPFEEFRVRLTAMMDNLLDLLGGDPGFRHFVLDGQTVPLDDYLDIRPDRRADIERLIREGRLLVGPNYMLPDEFLIGGEATIRNLQFGIRSGREYGKVMMVGYAPDAFGHIAHLPTVLRGFGIDSVMIWRGVGDEATTSEFRWASPDGSEVLAVHFPFGYGMLAVLPDDRDGLARTLGNVRAALEPLATTRYVLVPNGTDHLPAHQGLSGIIRTSNEILEDADVVHGNYPMFVDAVRRELGERYGDLPLLEGEFRSSKRSNVLAGVLSTRIWLKQRYQHCEDLLARYAEPAVAWASVLRSTDGGNTDRAQSEKGLLKHAWRLLLQNGPHDSVTGCSVDAVYDDVAARFNQCQQVAESVIHSAHRYIADAAAPGDTTAVAVFNTENGPRTDICTIRLPAGSDGMPANLRDSTEATVPLQIIERGGYSPADRRERVTAAFVSRDTPAFGYRTYRVEYSAAPDSGPADAGGRTPPAIETDLFRVSADADAGTFVVLDKRTGVSYPGLNRFVDGGERGDEYTYCPPQQDELIEYPSGPGQVRVTESGPVRFTLEMRMTYSLPTYLKKDRSARSDERTDCEIVTRARLYPGIPRIEFETEVDNRAQDHRLRVHFPTGVRTDISRAEQHFGVVERPVDVPRDDGTWYETPVGTYPQKTFVDVSSGERGLMIANRGLPEYEDLLEEDSTVTVAITLLRCVSWLSRDDLSTRRDQAGPPMHTPGAQLPGRWTFEYALVPHEGHWQEAWDEAHRFVRPLRAVRTTRGAGRLPPEASLLEVTPPTAVLSSLKLAEDSGDIVARAYNLADTETEAIVRLNHPHAGIEETDLNEENPRPADTSAGGARLTLRRNQIATLKFKES